MPIVFLRHGQSAANSRGLRAGQKEDSPLTDLGLKQARQAGRELTKHPIDRIISSKLKRTYRTANEVARIIGFDTVKIETDDRILEYDMGVLTGTPIKSLTPRERTSAAGAEDPVAFRNRILSFFNQYKDSQETILVISHAGVWRALEAARQKIDPRDFYSVPPPPNAHGVHLDLTWLD